MSHQTESKLPVDTLRALGELGTALTNHNIWTKAIHRTLICGSKPESKNLCPSAHHLCQFGQWYYGNVDNSLKEMELFPVIGELHVSLHDKARYLLEIKMEHRDITQPLYDDFINTVHSFRMAIQDLELDLISKVCSLDQLTGVWNRYSMHHKLAHEHERQRRHGNPCVIALLDFDHFKSINDRYGHLAGDEVLKTSMQFIIENIRSNDIIFRYGGEEFLLVLPESNIIEATELMDRIRIGLKQLAVPFKDQEIHFTVSIGLAAMSADVDVHDTVELADHAMFNAKMAGRDCVQVTDQVS